MTSRGEVILEEVRHEFAKFRKDPRAPSYDTAAISRLRARARSAMDWLEDTPAFDQAHDLLDEIGAFVRTTRPDACVVLFEDGTYYQTCSVALAHNRVGLSTTFVIRASECSVCRSDPWECEHVLGDEYDGQIAHLVITKADIVEVSLVSRPRQPDARIMKVSLSTNELADDLGPDFESGVEVICGVCLNPCPGVSDDLDRDAQRLRPSQKP